MNFDTHSHVPARTRTAGVKDKGRSSKRCFMVNGGPKLDCPKCNRQFYARSLTYGICLECRMGNEHQSPLERAIEILAARMEQCT